MGRLDGAAGRSTSGLSKLANGFTLLGVAALPAVAAGITGAVNLEQAIADVNASLGGVDASTLDRLEQGFMDIGAASRFSAVEVAAVGDEIARAGFATDTIVGMTQSVVDLSQATGADLMSSVSGITAAMQTWSPTIVDSTIALEDAGRAADIFTVAANASSADVQDIIAGLRNFGPTAASIGIGFDEASAAIAVFTNYGLKAADSGVSLTRAIQNLQDPTAEAQEVMDQFGLSVFDMQGNFIGLPALFDQLEGAFKDMTPEARNMALTTLFGAEALDVMTIAAMTGGDPLRMIQGEMEGTGQAAEQSALRMDTLKAQFGELVDSVQNLLGRMVGGLIPGFRAIVDAANGAIDVFSRLPQPILSAVGAVLALAAGFAALRGAAAGFQILSSLTGIAGGAGLAGGLGALAPILLGIAAAAGVAYAAIRFNLFGIGDAIDQFVESWNAIGSLTNNPISRFLSATSAALRSFDVGILDDLADAFSDASDRIGDAVDGFQDAWDFFFGQGDDAKKDAKKTVTATGLAKDGMEDLEVPLTDVNDQMGKLPGVAGEANDETARLARTLSGAEYPVTRFGQVLSAVGAGFERAGYDRMGRIFRDLGFTVDDLSRNFQRFRDQGAGPVSAAFLSLGETFPSLRTAMQGLAGVTTNLGDAFQAAVRGDWSQAFEELGMAAAGARTVLGEIGDVAVSIGNWIVGQIPDVWAWLRDTAIPAMGEALVTIGSVVVSGVTWVAGQIDSAWEWLKRWVLGGGNASGVAAGGAAAGGSLSGGIDLGSVALRVSDWIINSAVSIWERIKQWVLGTGGGVSGGGRAAGGNVATSAGTGIPIGAVPITISEWPIVANAIDVWNSITSWVDDAITVTDAEAAAFEPKGREIGRTIMSGILKGLRWILDLDNFLSGGGVGGGGGAAGGGAGPLGAGGSFGNGLWRYIKPMFEGAWEVLQGELENWGTQLQRDYRQWWNSFMPSLFQAELPGTPLQKGGDALAGGITGAFPTMFESLLADIQSAWDGFKSKVSGIFDGGIDLPSINIDWSSITGPIADGWQTVITAFDAIIEWFRDPFASVGGITISLPSIDIDWGPIDGLITTIGEKATALSAAWAGLKAIITGGAGSGPMPEGPTSLDPSERGNPEGAVPVGFFSRIVAEIEAGGASVSAAFDAAGVQWADARNRAIANLSGGGIGAAGAAAGAGATSILGGLVASIGADLGQVTITITAKGAEWAGAMQAATGLTGQAAQTGLVPGLQAATTAVSTHSGAWPQIVSAQAGPMGAAGGALGEAVHQGLIPGMQAGTTAVSTHAGSWAAIVSSFEGTMYEAGSGVGAQAGQGVADGLISKLGAVQSAAAAIISAVAGAMTAAAMIASPSRLTYYYGEMMGAGLIGGLNAMQPRVAAASASLMQTASPYMPANTGGAGGQYTTVSAPVRVNATITAERGLTDSDVKEIATKFGQAVTQGVEIVYVANGASS